ncbi:MAG: FAD-dependent oxidoreductase [Bdellovibrionaceae bacterium]|nr:FAD-dependent oxidoreductase [Pseudobdellovibrionaceae bacterium]
MTMGSMFNRGDVMGSASYSPYSLWQKIEMPVLPELDRHVTVDVCVIGGGIAGLMTAYELLRSGRKVAVLERHRLGMGDTGLTSAHLSNILDEGFKKIIQLHGLDGARLAYESHAAAIDEIERIQNEEGIDCEFKRVDGYLFQGTEGTPKELKDELDACRDLGVDGVESVRTLPLKSFDPGGALFFPRQAQFHSLKFLRGLVGAIFRMGGEIYTETTATEIGGGSAAFVRTHRGFTVSCSSVVMATGVPFQGGLSIHTKEAAYRSYVIVLEIEKGVMPDILLWDTETPYHFVRKFSDLETGREYLIAGGEDHKTGQDALPLQHFENLQNWVVDRLGLTGTLVNQWSGQITEPVDGLAYLGRHPNLGPNVYSISGDSGHGLTHATIGALLLTDLINGHKNEWESLYDPSRTSWMGLGGFLAENSNLVAQYADWVSLGDVASESEIPPGEGAVMRRGLRKVAVYRDQAGDLHRLSAVCPHLGGLVRWNSAEKTWDCPCHGSRFDSTGDVLNGPAIEGLGKEDVEEEIQREPRDESLNTLELRRTD